jgi:hypothetical protein
MLPARRRVRCTSRGTFSHSSLEEMSTAIRASRSLMPPPPRLPLLPVVHGTENKQTLRPGSILVVLAGSVTSSSRNFSAFARSPGLSAPGACGARTSLGPCRVFVLQQLSGKRDGGGNQTRQGSSEHIVHFALGKQTCAPDAFPVVTHFLLLSFGLDLRARSASIQHAHSCSETPAILLSSSFEPGPQRSRRRGGGARAPPCSGSRLP